MNTIWKMLLSGLAVFCFPAMLSAETLTSPLNVDSHPELKRFPKLDVPEAVYKNVEKSYIFDGNGACEFRQKTELRVNTLFAMNELCGETFIVYNPKFQRVKIHAAYTIMADGITRVDVPENAFNTVLPRCAADAPDFNFLRELVITHTALEPGASIFLDYSVFYSAGSGMLFDEYADMPFPCERLVMNFNGSTTEYFNVPARSREQYFTAKKSVPVIYPGMPSVAPRNFTSTENLELGDFGKGILQDLINERMTEGEKIAAIARFVREQVATVPIPSSLLSESDLRGPDGVLKAAYGTPLEKARLLWVMLSGISENHFRIVHDSEKDVFSVKGDLGAPIFVNAKTDVFEKIDVKARCEFSEGGEIIRGTASFAGANAATNPEETAKGLIAGSLKNTKATWLPENRLEIEAEREADSREGIRLWRVPVATKGIAAFDFETLPKARKSELEIPVSGDVFSESYVYTIRVPENWVLAGGSRVVEVRNPIGTVSFLVAEDGAEIVVRKMLNLKKTTISPEEYSQFRALAVAWFAPANNRLLFIPKGEKQEATVSDEKL